MTPGQFVASALVFAALLAVSVVRTSLESQKIVGAQKVKSGQSPKPVRTVVMNAIDESNDNYRQTAILRIGLAVYWMAGRDKLEERPHLKAAKKPQRFDDVMAADAEIDEYIRKKVSRPVLPYEVIFDE